MAERPIIFTAESVLAILNGRKTQTRRVVKLREFQRSDTPGYDHTFRDLQLRWHDYREGGLLASKRVPFHAGDRLWVKETCRIWLAGMSGRDACVEYKADGESVVLRGGHINTPGCHVDFGADATEFAQTDERWRSPMYMPRWASRLTLEVLSVRTERVQSITEEDARAEGVDANRFRGTDDCWDPLNNRGKEYRTAFAYAWGEIHGWEGESRTKPGHSWASNPWVWVISFRRVTDG